jgi:hypothetical protein
MPDRLTRRSPNLLRRERARDAADPADLRRPVTITAPTALPVISKTSGASWDPGARHACRGSGGSFLHHDLFSELSTMSQEDCILDTGHCLPIGIGQFLPQGPLRDDRGHDGHSRRDT